MIPGEAIYSAQACQGDQFYRARLSRLETHRRTGGNIQAHAARLLARKRQGVIGFIEVIMRADLNRPVAGVRHRQGDRGSSDIQFNVACCYV